MILGGKSTDPKVLGSEEEKCQDEMPYLQAWKSVATENSGQNERLWTKVIKTSDYGGTGWVVRHVSFSTPYKSVRKFESATGTAGEFQHNFQEIFAALLEDTSSATSTTTTTTTTSTASQHTVLLMKASDGSILKSISIPVVPTRRGQFQLMINGQFMK